MLYNIYLYMCIYFDITTTIIFNMYTGTYTNKCCIITILHSYYIITSTHLYVKAELLERCVQGEKHGSFSICPELGCCGRLMPDYNTGVYIHMHSILVLLLVRILVYTIYANL